METVGSVYRQRRWSVRCSWRGYAGGEEAWREAYWRGDRHEARGSQEGPGKDLPKMNRYTGREGNLRPHEGRSTRWAEDEGGRVTLPEERAGRRGVGRVLTSGSEKKVQREESERARREGMAGGSLQ